MAEFITHHSKPGGTENGKAQLQLQVAHSELNFFLLCMKAHEHQ